MIFVIVLSLIVFCLPLVCFLVAIVAEARSYKRDSIALLTLRMAEIGASATALLATTWVRQSRSLSWTMVCAMLLLGALMLVSNYASKVALRCVLIGTVVAAFLWYFKGAYHP